MASRLRGNYKGSDLTEAIKGLLEEKLRECSEDIMLDPAPRGRIRLRSKTDNWQHVEIKIEVQ